MSKRIESEKTPQQIQVNYSQLPKNLVYSLDVCGPEGSGKTHFALTWPGDIVFIDTELKAEAVIPKFIGEKNILWKPAESFADIRNAVDDALRRPEVNTIIIDSGADLASMASEEWCTENGKRSVYPITQYQHVYNKIDELSGKIKKARKFLVSTSRMKDEWIGDASTGNRIRDGYKRFPWDLHFAIEIQWGFRDTTTGRMWYQDRRFGRVIKNGFWGIDTNKGIVYSKPYLFNVSFEGVKNELTVPWNNGVPLSEVQAKLLAEANSLYEPQVKRK